MIGKELFENALKKDWYIQSFNAVPLLLNGPTLSGFSMKKELGFGYDSFLMNYKDGYCEMGYLNEDFDRLWKIIKGKLSKDPLYLEKVKNTYEKNFKKLEKQIEEITLKELANMSDQKLLETLKLLVLTLTDGVGVGHVIEPLGIHLEKEFKEDLSKELPDKSNFNEYYALLSSPTKSSFLTDEEAELDEIRKSPKNSRDRKLEKHAQKYFWIRSSYSGSEEVTVEEFKSRLKEVNVVGKNWDEVVKQKKQLLKKLNFSKEIKSLVRLIEYLTIWQDERKKNILKTIGYIERAISEVSRRMNIDRDMVHHLSATEVLNLKSLQEISKKKEELENRKKGVLFILSSAGELIASGKEYEAILKDRKSSDVLDEKQTDIYGSIANRGTAMGRVIICKDISMLDKVEKGDILVTSMTRPEFMPALKRAGAIITDEGGITCHAAIVARELNIPAIIGTKIATKLLHDGMMVEVRANHGFIRIINPVSS